jgi:hypothetical protein
LSESLDAERDLLTKVAATICSLLIEIRQFTVKLKAVELLPLELNTVNILLPRWIVD